MSSKLWKVIKIIDDYRIVINAGAVQGITEDTKLEIYVPGEEILDPDTGAKLGTLDYIKAYLKVVHAYENMSICRNYEIKEASLFDFGVAFTKYELKTLKVDKTQITGGLNEEDKIIRIGDLVKKSC